jgi:FMN phosphatase YigB (HAD superfamily)
MTVMTEVYLFDWGDTLMVDFPGVDGKMCDWKTVEVMEGAEEALSFISKQAQIYIATGAAESTEEEIKKAFTRVGLEKYITGYFCKANLGVEKGSPEFLSSILSKLGRDSSQVTMVGDSFEKDIEPALKLSINTIWLSREKEQNSKYTFKTISSLKELCF